MIKMIGKLMIVSTMALLLSACGTISSYKISGAVFQESESASGWYRSSYMYVIFKAKNNDTVKYLCSTDVCGTLVKGTRYNITISDNSYANTKEKITEAVPVVAEQ